MMNEDKKYLWFIGVSAIGTGVAVFLALGDNWWAPYTAVAAMFLAPTSILVYFDE